MKIVRVILIILVVLVVIVGILTVIAPTKTDISRSIVINAPAEVVWNNISKFDNTRKWSPFLEMDPNAKTAMEGIDGTVGAVWRWEGKKVGTGSQTVTDIDEMRRVDSHLAFLKPFKGEAETYTEMTDSAGQVKVTWGYTSTASRPMNIFNLFMDMRDIFDKGLKNLKSLSEQEASSSPKTYRGYDIKETDMPAKVYVGKRATVSFKDMSKFFGDNLHRIGEDAGKAKLEVTGPPSGIFFTFDTVKMNSDMAAAFPVKEVKSPVKGWETINTPAGKALAVDYYGAYDKAQPAYMAIDDYMNQKGMKSRMLVVEEYITDPMVEKDTAKWLTKIYYYIE